MVKLYIPKSNTKRFQGLFKFFFKEECELCVFPEGLKWRKNDKTIEGIICKDAFIDYDFTQRQKLGIVAGNIQNMKNWFDDWKTIARENGSITEITFK